MPQFIDLVTAALTDPFRIALIIGLVITQARTAANTGTVLPLAIGVAFVAVIIPTTFGYDESLGLPMVVGAGALANVALLAAVLVARRLWARRQG